jgi:ABC-2 type transport system permease protein
MTVPTTAASDTDRHRHARVLGVELAEGLRAVLREPTALFFSVIFPVVFFALFASIFGSNPGAGSSMLAGYGTFGVVSVMLLNPAMTVADDRTRGWLRVKKVSAAPIGTTIAAKVLAALPYAGGVVLALSLVSLLEVGPIPGGLGAWLRLVGVLLLGALPFALLGLAVGFVASSNATAAILNAVLFPMVIASGLWFPVAILPSFVQAIAPVLPTYHLAQLAHAQLTGGPWLTHILALLATTAIAGGLAALAYRNLRV